MKWLLLFTALLGCLSWAIWAGPVYDRNGVWALDCISGFTEDPVQGDISIDFLADRVLRFSINGRQADLRYDGSFLGTDYYTNGVIRLRIDPEVYVTDPPRDQIYICAARLAAAHRSGEPY